METGQKITWKSVNGKRVGVVYEQCEFGYKVFLPSGKMVIVHPNSIIDA